MSGGVKESKLATRWGARLGRTHLPLVTCPRKKSFARRCCLCVGMPVARRVAVGSDHEPEAKADEVPSHQF